MHAPKDFTEDPPMNQAGVYPSRVIRGAATCLTRLSMRKSKVSSGLLVVGRLVPMS